MLANLKGIFSPAAIAQSLDVLTPMETTIMDSLFKDRPTHPLPLIGLSELVSVVQTVPVVRRDGTPVSLKGDSMSMEFIAPLPVKVKIPVSASELNDLRVIMGNKEAVAAWRTRKVDKIRETVRNTTEAMCSIVATTGKLSWPVELEGGRREVYELDYGTPLSHTLAAKLTRESTLPDVYNLLREMEKTIKQAGLGGNVEFWAGSDVVSVLLGIVNACVSTTQSSPYNLKLEQGRISVGSFVIRFMDETYPDPADESRWLNKLNPKTLLATATNVKGTVWYCAIDSISANNAAIPLHIVPVMRDDDSGITLIGQAKPLPARPSRGTCLCLAVD